MVNVNNEPVRKLCTYWTFKVSGNNNGGIFMSIWEFSRRYSSNGCSVDELQTMISVGRVKDFLSDFSGENTLKTSAFRSMGVLVAQFWHTKLCSSPETFHFSVGVSRSLLLFIRLPLASYWLVCEWSLSLYSSTTSFRSRILPKKFVFWRSVCDKEKSGYHQYATHKIKCSLFNALLFGTLTIARSAWTKQSSP